MYLRNICFAFLLSFSSISLYSQCEQYLFVVDNSGSIDAGEFASFQSQIASTISALGGKCSNVSVGVVHYGGNFGSETVITETFKAPSAIGAISKSIVRASTGTTGEGDDLNVAFDSINMYMMPGGALMSDASCSQNVIIFTDANSVGCAAVSPNRSCIEASSILTPGGVLRFSSSVFSNAWVIKAPDVGDAGAVTYLTANYVKGDGSYIPISFSDPASTVANNVVGAINCPPAPKVPTMGEWALIILSLLMTIFAFIALKNRNSITIAHS